ncbi:MAG: DNA primase catalytic subunit PriS [Thermoplasmatales archaeon]
MNETSAKFVEDYFRKYYGTVSSFGIKSVMKREIAFSPFSKKGMIRHTSFPSMESLVNYVRENTPLHFYYSSAYYENPAASMENKIWTGADLIFDIDGDHIPGSEGMGYGEMLATVKLEVNKLLNLLTDDLGVEEKYLEVVFSGSRGYHVHIYSIFEGLESQERRELVDYISGRCVAETGYLFPKTKWAERVSSITSSLLDLLNSKSSWRKMLEERTHESTGNMTKKEIREKGYIERNAKKLAIELYASKIDEPVTIDIHRLIRTPGSLHGKTAMKVMQVGLEKLEDFDPLTEAIADNSEDSVSINVLSRSTVEIGGEKIRVEEGRAKIPEYAAIFLILRGVAEIISE